ncbi:uncharacterized protein LOC117334247 [Pecten maximus]|uniref:uncharacterized protein LOC117334247 n=1 Tax=Pecten maximus TaxID=6579 RepID=UPI0014589D68|nr:uncharacterized protein LOC117334247 [Pecten maximus]
MELSFEQQNVIEEIMQTETVEKDKQTEGFITIYDFGGEKVFYNTHHCFMSSNMVFVLVFDVAMCLDPTRAKDGYERIETWLRSIATYAIDQAADGKGTPPVILIGSHLDTISQDRKKQEEAFGKVLKKLYENPQLSSIMENHVQEMYPIAHLNDSKKNQDLYEVVWNKVIEIAPLQSQWKKPIPARWLALQHQLIKRKNAGTVILTYEELLEINNKSAIPLVEHEVTDFLRNLIFAGFLCFDFDSLRPFVVLRPQWIINGFKSIITDPSFMTGLSTKIKLQWTKYERTGVLTLDLIQQIWELNDDKSFLANKKTLYNIMETLGLLANPLLDISNEVVDYFIVPSMLRPADQEIIRPVLDDPETIVTVTLCLKFDNPFIPLAVWDKMIAACLHRFQRLNERGHDGSKFIQRGFVCLAVDFLWNVIVNCQENVMKITMFKKDTDQSVPTGAGVNLRSILEFHLNRILELNHQSHLKYQFYLHNDYRFSADDKMVKVDDLRQTSRLQCHSSDNSRWLEIEDIHIWFKHPDQKSTRTQRSHVDSMKDLPDRNLSVKEMGRLSRHIGISYQTFFVELGCPVVVLEQKMAENRVFSFRSLITKIFIYLLQTDADVTFTRIANAMSEHGLNQETLYNILDDNRDTLFNDDTLSEGLLQKCLTVYDVPVIAEHVNPKDYFNLFLELGFTPKRVDEFDVDFRNDTSPKRISAMVEEFIENHSRRPALNTVLLAMVECDMDTNSLIQALTQTK